MIAKGAFSPQFKAKAALELIKEEKSVSELAALYEVHYTLLHKWRRELLEGLPKIFEDPRKKERDDKDALIRERYSQVGRLTMQYGGPHCQDKKAYLYSFSRTGCLC